MAQFKPPAAPGCWGLKYQDGEKECEQCRYNESCRPAMLERCTSDGRMTLPVIRTYNPPPVPSPPTIYQQRPVNQTAIVPMPAKPYYPPPPVSVPARQASVPMPPQPVAQPQAPQQQYYQTTTGYSLPSYANPNPMTPMHRPGASAPAYYFTHYQGESVALRVIKNLLLRAFEAIFGELWQFFKHFTWPPKTV